MSPHAPATAQELSALRRQLTAPDRGLRNDRVIDALLRVPRHEFAPAYLRALAYDDGPLPIGHGQTISQPFIVGFMTEAIDPRATDRVLEVGTGCGYQTAVLAELVGEVFTLEVVPALASQARATLERLGYTGIHHRTGDGRTGWPEAAPFDAIVVTCAPQEIPLPLLGQLRVGGRMILPLGNPGGNQSLVRIERTPGGYEQEELMPVRFVPMRH